ncbi:hypothetical protein GCM10022254_15020 [Actinomadura meridiana]|uniref:DivIVA domain-containing protein n=1 Tax=Actinomadura meridiana TaxID=559626 RepID=A0ABP8BVC2_9ACTN
MTSPGLPREDLTAAISARRELGPDYDDAFVETVVDRIEAALDARSATAPDVRSRTLPRGRQRPGTEPWPGDRGSGDRDHGLALAVLSLLAAIPLSAIAVVNAGLAGLFVTMAAIVLVNVAYTQRPRR